jgi:phosphomannomutase
MRRGLDCFKAYDIRGRLGETLDESIAARIGAAFGHVLEASTHVVVGHDARETSPVAEGRGRARPPSEIGADVTDIGLCGTEEVYFATGHLGADGGLMVTASHNPIEWNGMKLVGPGSRPIDPGHELALDPRDWREAGLARRRRRRAGLTTRTRATPIADRVAGFARGLSGRPFRIVADSRQRHRRSGLRRRGRAGSRRPAPRSRSIRLRHAPDPSVSARHPQSRSCPRTAR